MIKKEETLMFLLIMLFSFRDYNKTHFKKTIKMINYIFNLMTKILMSQAKIATKIITRII